LGQTLPTAEEPAAFYVDRLQQRYTRRELKKALNECQKQYQNQDLEGALDHMLAEAQRLSLEQHRNQVVENRPNAYDIVVSEYNAKWKLGDEYGIQLGYPTLDAMNGGLMSGDVMVMAGRPAAGKSFALLAMADHIWRTQKKTPLLLSMEMPILQISQRLAAMQSQVPLTHLRHADLSSNLSTQVKQTLTALQHEDRPFWMVDGNLAASVADLQMYVQQLQPDVVIVDGAYLMNPGQAKKSEWEKVKAVIEGLKQNIAQSLGIPVIASYQLNREAAKTKKGDDYGTEMLANSDAIGQIASVVLGMMEEENIENLVSKRVSILKGRNGESGGFSIRWQFDGPAPNFMDFSEIETEQDHMPFV